MGSSSKPGGVVFNSPDAAGLSLMFGGMPLAQPSRSQSDFTGASAAVSSRPEPTRNATDQPFTQQNIHGSWGAPLAQSPEPRRASQPQGLGLHDTGQGNANTWQGFGGASASIHRHSVPTSTTSTPPQNVPQSKGWANWEHDLTKVQRVDPNNTREREIQSNMDTRVNAGVSPLLKPQTTWSQASHMPGQLQPMASVQTLRSEFMGSVSSVASPSPISSYATPDHPASRPHSVMTQSHTSWNLPAGGDVAGGARGSTPGNVPLLSTIPPNMIYGQSLNTTMPPPMPQIPPQMQTTLQPSQQPAQPLMQSLMQSQMQPPMPPPTQRHDTSNSISSMSSFSSLPPQAFPPQHMAAQNMATQNMRHAQWPPAQGSMPPTQTMWELDGSSVDHAHKVDHAGHAHYAASVVEQIHELSSVQFAPDPVELPATSYRYER